MTSKIMHMFDRDISLLRLGPCRFKADVSDNWSINGNPNGGYLMAILANAALNQSEKKSIAIFTANFISRCAPEEAQLLVEEIHRSRHFDRRQVRLFQKEREKVRALITLTDRGVSEERTYEKPPPDLPRPEECIQIPPIANYHFFQQMDVRLDPLCAGWLQGRLSDKSEQKGWVRFKDDRPYDEVSIFPVVDAFTPPVIATHGFIAWVPTIEFSVNIRNVPGTKWLKCIFRSHFISHGLVEEDGEVWDEGGELIAISRQISRLQKAEVEKARS